MQLLGLSEICEKKTLRQGVTKKIVLRIPTTYILPPYCRHVLDYEDVIRALVGPLRLHDSDCFVPPSSCQLPKLLLIPMLHDTRKSPREFVTRIDREFLSVRYVCCIYWRRNVFSYVTLAKFKFKGTYYIYSICKVPDVKYFYCRNHERTLDFFFIMFS